MSLNPLKGTTQPRKQNVMRNEDGINHFEAGSVRHMADGDFTYAQRGILPAPTNTVPVRVLAAFGHIVQGRR